MSSRESEQMFTKMADLEKIWQHITCKNEKYHFYFPIAVLNHSNPSNNRDSTHTHTHIQSVKLCFHTVIVSSHSHTPISTLVLWAYLGEENLSYCGKIGSVKLNWGFIYGHIHLVNTSTPPCSNSH